MEYHFRRMTLLDVDQVCEIENELFPIPWSKKSFLHELKKNKAANYWVCLYLDKVIAYGGFWHIINEGHITNIGVKESFQSKGVGHFLLSQILKEAKQMGLIGISLEVKYSNVKAQRLYTKLGFRPEGLRKNYYQDTNEDAIIMWHYFDKPLF